MAEQSSPTWSIVAHFAGTMEQKLATHHWDRGGPEGWRDDDLYALLDRMDDERDELLRAIDAYYRLDFQTRKDRHDPAVAAAIASIREEAADIANFAMMIADTAAHAAGES